MLHVVDEDVAAALEGVGEMEDEERIGVEPLRRAAVERDQADARAHARPPLQERLSLPRRRTVEHRRTGEQHDIAFRQHEVVDHGRRGERDRKALREIARRVDLVEFERSAARANRRSRTARRSSDGGGCARQA